MKMNLFQSTIFSFITSIQTSLTVEQKFEISLALLTVDYSVLQIDSFMSVFASLSFSSDVEFNAEIVAISESAEFVSIDLVMNVLVLFVQQGVKIDVINTFDMTSVVSAEFWTMTSIDASILLSVIESTNVDVTIMSKDRVQIRYCALFEQTKMTKTIQI